MTKVFVLAATEKSAEQWVEKLRLMEIYADWTYLSHNWRDACSPDAAIYICGVTSMLNMIAEDIDNWERAGAQIFFTPASL